MNETLIVAFTGVVALSTVFYVVITCWLAWETRKMRTAQNEPRVSVQLELNSQVGHGGMQLSIRNEGSGPAHEIKFDFSGNPDYFIQNGAGVPVDQLPVIRDGIKYLGPDRQFTILLGFLFGEAFLKATEHPWIFRVQYKDQNGKSKDDSYVLDFSQFSHLIIGDGDPLRKIAKSIESIDRELLRWGTGFHKLQVVTHPKQNSRPVAQQPSKEEFESQMAHLGIPVEKVVTDAEPVVHDGNGSE